ncbi:helix-turn-helix domain-containing protein [Streptomyces sp. cg28]|uniref:helix-turn-helix domain-containing protein n=1 Tax=Streptomyces sp. cg28 TaxID=3403457 RepID=UPI003B20B766
MVAQQKVRNVNDVAAKGNSEKRGSRLAGQYMGFGGLLRGWRKAAHVNQPRAARALGISERTYRKIEHGATPPRLTSGQCESLADELGLDAEQRHVLMLHNVGSALIPPRGTAQPQLQRALRLLIDRQMPSPAYLCDQNWNILGFNSAMAEWWPWVMEPGANLIRWALTSVEARTQYQDWDMHAHAYVKMLKFAEAAKPDDATLRELIEDIQKDPDARQVWDTESHMGETRDGHVFRMNVPALDWETVEVVSHVLYPASMPEARFVVITWVEGGEGERDALGGIRNAWADAAADAADVETAQRHTQNRVAEDAATRWRREVAALASRKVVSTPEEAAALAGDKGVPMPAIGRLMGPDARLTLDPARRTVIWAAEETAGLWSVTRVSPSTVVARVPRAAITDDVLSELLALVRIALPAEDDAALSRVALLLDERATEQRILHEVRDMIQTGNA